MPDLQPPASGLQSSMTDLQPPTSGLQLTPAASTAAQASGLKTEAYVPGYVPKLPMANISMQNHSNVANQLNDCRQGFQLAPPIVKK